MTNKVEVDFKEWKDYDVNIDAMSEEIAAWFQCYIQEDSKVVAQGEKHTNFNRCLDSAFLDCSHTFSRNSVKQLAFALTWKVGNSYTMLNYTEALKESESN